MSAPKRTTPFDPDCQDLAEHFLADEPYTQATAGIHESRVVSLAQAIQEAVEAWFDQEPN